MVIWSTAVLEHGQACRVPSVKNSESAPGAAGAQPERSSAMVRRASPFPAPTYGQSSTYSCHP